MGQQTIVHATETVALVYAGAKKVAIRPIRTPMLTVDDVAPLGLPQVDIADRQAKGAETDEK